MDRERCSELEVFSRVTGFFRPVQSWNKGKQEEFSDRKKYSMDTRVDGYCTGDSTEN
ncbi:MAG: anaerobic ribonucleoside-triphosphate reductase [Candidatus Omnitrophota bacterium]